MSLSIRYTRGFLLDLRRRLEFIRDAHELLEMKRDQLMRELKTAIGKLREAREKLEEQIEEVLRELALLQAVYGFQEIQSASWLLDQKLEVEIIPRNVMGVNVPKIKSVKIPDVRGKYPLHVAGVAEKASSLIRGLLHLAELESFIELISEDLRRTNVRVNALEKVVIPSYERMIKKIDEIIDQNMLEEFMRVKLVKKSLARRRGEA
ncbi:MAG: hypothetical protein DRN61_03880 [Thaumarchaeota archaeon]|nr:MAG: hypothetical protein DRN61_03880 [Nitrososphaerota archaeon]